MADYDLGEVTERERLAAERQKEIAGRHADAVRNQLDRSLYNYDYANQQNRRLADIQLKQNARKTEADRFEANRNLQNASLGLFGSLNQAMNGSATGNLMRMLENRSDADNVTYWGQHQQNADAINNAYQESYNQNQVAKMDAIANAEKAIRDIEDDLAANLANINPNLYESPGTGSARFNATELYNENRVNPNLAQMSGYLMPQDSVQNARKVYPRNRVGGSDYFGSLVNRFNGR